MLLVVHWDSRDCKLWSPENLWAKVEPEKMPKVLWPTSGVGGLGGLGGKASPALRRLWTLPFNQEFKLSLSNLKLTWKNWGIELVAVPIRSSCTRKAAFIEISLGMIGVAYMQMYQTARAPQRLCDLQCFHSIRFFMNTNTLHLQCLLTTSIGHITWSAVYLCDTMLTSNCDLLWAWNMLKHSADP